MNLKYKKIIRQLLYAVHSTLNEEEMIMDKKILVVDDEKPIADILEFNLKKEGYDVHCAYDGNEALEMVEELNPDLILLDIMLPNKDGVEVCREVRKNMTCPSSC